MAGQKKKEKISKNKIRIQVQRGRGLVLIRKSVLYSNNIMVSITGLNPEDLASSQKKKMVNGKLKFKFGFDSENQYFAFKIICGRISAI